MKKKIFSIALATTLIVSLLPVSRAEEEGTAVTETDPIVQIGLYYGSSALDGANLENAVGTG